MDTRWARTWKPDESKPSGRRAKALLIIKGFTDPDLFDIESHSPTLTRVGFLTVLQSVCSHKHKLQFGDVQQAFNTGTRSRENNHSSSECRPMESQVNRVKFGLAVEGMEELFPCYDVAGHKKYHGITGGDEIWEQAISKLKKRETFGHWEVGKGKFCSREVVQAADESMRVGQPAYIKNLDFLLLGKMRKEQSGDANETEKVSMRSMLGALGYSARESRPDLSGPVSILQSRFNRDQVSDMQETNRVVRLAKAHTDLALPVCEIPVDQVCFVSYGDASGGSTRAEQAQAGYVIMFADMSLLAGLAAPVTLVSLRSRRVERVCSQCLCSGGHGSV